MPGVACDRWLHDRLDQGILGAWARPDRRAASVEFLGAAFVRRIVGAPLAGGEPELERAARIQQLMQRLVRHKGGRLCQQLEREGIPTVLIKGAGVAQRHWPEPELRPFSDLDILVRPDDLARAVAWLGDHGYCALDVGAGRSRAGRWLSRAARRVLASQGGCALVPPTRDLVIDLHAHVERNPVPRTLATEAILAASTRVVTDWGSIRVPAAEHAFAIAALHAHRSHYDCDQTKTVLDGLMIAASDRPALVARLPALAEGGGFWQRVLFFTSLIRRLARQDPLPELPAWQGQGWRQRLLDQALARITLDRADPPSTMAKLGQPPALADSWAEYGARFTARLGDLTGPRRHVPIGLQTIPPPATLR